MDVRRVSNRDPMDYNLDSMEPKHGKAAPCQDERLDSGVDSMKEDELVNAFEELHVKMTSDELAAEHEPWRSAVTDDGDT